MAQVVVVRAHGFLRCHHGIRHGAQQGVEQEFLHRGSVPGRGAGSFAHGAQLFQAVAQVLAYVYRLDPGRARRWRAGV